jgi:hypothetical protein
MSTAAAYPVPYDHVTDILTMKATEHEVLIYLVRTSDTQHNMIKADIAERILFNIISVQK